MNDDELGVDVEREAVALKDSFRLQCSQYFLTYSGLARMPTDAEVRALIDKIAQTKPVKFWHYAADKHDDTEGYHIHLLVDYGTRIDVKGEAAKLYFDWTFPTAKGGSNVHPNIRKKSKG